MTQLQETEFDLLLQVDSICKALQIPYFLVCGSALGAIKYQGFIPWDDDIDVAMYREDYERFVREAPGLLAEHLFLQNHRTDPAFPQIFSKLRNSNTTYIERSVAHLPIHQGIFIDIFPLDGYPVSLTEQNRLERRKRILSIMMHSACEPAGSWRGKLVFGFCKMLGCHKRTASIAARYERMIRQYPVENSIVLCNHGNWQGKLDYSPKSHFGEGSLATFEGLTVRIPVEYDAYLTQKYGAWREDLPPEEQQGHHYYMVCDCARPYTEYMNQIGGK